VRLSARVAIAMALAAVVPIGMAALLVRATRSVQGIDWTNILLVAAAAGTVIALLLAWAVSRSIARSLREVADSTGGKQVLDAADKKLRRAERIAAWRDIARQMAHEIKNPLTPIQMAVEMLRKARERHLPDFDALFDEQTRIVLEEVARLRRLVENFSRFARAPKVRPEPVQLEELVAHVVGLHAARDDVEVTGEAAAGLPMIRADREQLTQVLVNIVANGCHFAAERAISDPDRGPAAVHVAASAVDHERVIITVEDNGPGIPEAILPRLFEPYTTTRAGGTGLGLAIAFRIVNEHGGTLAVDSSPQGTRFEIQLPIAGPTVPDVTLDTHDSGRTH